MANSFGDCFQLWSKAQPKSELSLEGNTQRLGESGCSEEVDRLPEVWAAGGPVIRVPKIPPVKHVVSFEEQRELRLFAQRHELGHPQIDLSEGAATGGPGRQVFLVIPIPGLTVIEISVPVNVTAAARRPIRQYVVRPR